MFDRQVRVFVSSTFRDMQLERDQLVKKIFPQLRQLCEERAVSFVEVDLRWGITDQEASEGKVLPLCLAEIERCRPWFVGLLGERYGWVPDSIPPAVRESLPWLQERSQQSVTELEILHGVLRDPAMAGRALFYFRDPAYVEHVPADQRSDFVSDGPEHAAKLRDLKQRIRDAHACGALRFAPREAYPDPVALGDLVLADLAATLDDEFPPDEVPSPLAQEAARHEATAQALRLAFIGREALLKRLDAHVCATGTAPIVVTGQSGTGKSAALAEWAHRWRRDHPEDLVVQHYIGATPASAEWEALVRRLLEELKLAFGLIEEVPTRRELLAPALGEWLVRCSGNRRVVLVIDALDQLTDDPVAGTLGWLPIVFPPSCRVVLSALPGPVLGIARARNWQEVGVSLFSTIEVTDASAAYLGLFRKELPASVLGRITASPQAHNALYLRAVLDELRQFGVHERLAERAEYYLSAPDLPVLFDRILTRWNDDFGRDPACPDLVGQALALIAASRSGLSQAELLELLGPVYHPLPRRAWTPFYLAAESSLARHGELLGFGHDGLRAAVWKRWLEGQDAVREHRARLARYFKSRPKLSPRRLEELPWLLLQTRDLGGLREVIGSLPVFQRMASTPGGRQDLHACWIALGPDATPGAVYGEAFARIDRLLADLSHSRMEDYDDFDDMLYLHEDGVPVDVVRNNVGHFLLERGESDLARPLLQRALEQEEASERTDDASIVPNLVNLAETDRGAGRNDLALVTLRRAKRIVESDSGCDRHIRATVLNNLADVLQDLLRFDEAEPLYREVLADEDEATQHPSETSSTQSNLGRLLQKVGRLEEAQDLFRKALATDERWLGPGHPQVARSLNNLADLLRITNRPDQAEPMFRRALAIYEETLPAGHPFHSTVLSNLGLLCQAANRFDEAEALLQRALADDQRSQAPDHPSVARDLNNLSLVYFGSGRFAEAGASLRQAVSIDVARFGEDHPEVATDLKNLACVLIQAGDHDAAETEMRRAIGIDERHFGEKHQIVLNDLQQLVMMLMAMDRTEPATRAYQQLRDRGGELLL
jgi:nephrocystin-3